MLVYYFADLACQLHFYFAFYKWTTNLQSSEVGEFYDLADSVYHQILQHQGLVVVDSYGEEGKYQSAGSRNEHHF